LTQSTLYVWSKSTLVDGKLNLEQMMLGLGGDTPFSGFPDNGTSGDLPKSKYRIYFNDLDGSYLMIPNQE
jgi:hypothetical protein